MVATLPGRTHGLGLVTEPLLAELNLDRVAFAAMNFWATLIGSAFCLPAGWLIDRKGLRFVLTSVLISLGVVVIVMSGIRAGGWELTLWDLEGSAGRVTTAIPLALFVLVLLTRGLGQSALSVVSLALIGKATSDRPGVAMGVYSFLVAVGFMTAFAVVKTAFEQFQADWRTVWASIGWILISLGIVSALLVRNPSSKPAQASESDNKGNGSITLGQAVQTPAFWVFALATSFYGLVASGMSLFHQSLLAERGFDRGVFLTITTLTPLVGLGANLLSGWLAVHIRLGRILAAALLIQASALAAFPAVSTLVQVYVYAVALGVSGGALTVVFFTVWRQAFGPAYLGQIQGVAQLLTVLASALGPLVLALGHRFSGSYAPVIQDLAIVALGLALAALVVPLPSIPACREDNNT
jgi:MFS family permease